MDFEPKLLPPGGSCEAIVVFKPRDAIKYYEEVPFEINGLLRKTIAVRGEGTQTKVRILSFNLCPMSHPRLVVLLHVTVIPLFLKNRMFTGYYFQIELVNPVQRTVNFGALRVNQTASKKVKLINRSPISVVCSVSIMPSSSVPALQAESVLFVSPSGDFSLLPNAIKEIEITFSPKSRVTQFSEEVWIITLHKRNPNGFIPPSPGDPRMPGVPAAIAHCDWVMSRSGNNSGQRPCSLWGCCS